MNTISWSSQRLAVMMDEVVGDWFLMLVAVKVEKFGVTGSLSDGGSVHYCVVVAVDAMDYALNVSLVGIAFRIMIGFWRLGTARKRARSRAAT
jgi:hypothetical protein